MKKLLTGVAAVATLIAGPALADPNDNQTITINGTSPNVCLLQSGASASAVTNATLGATDITNTLVTVNQLADATNADLIATSITLTFSAMCNGVHTVTLNSLNGGLLNANRGTNAPVATSGNFIRKVGYTAGYTWAGATATAAQGFQFVNDIGAGAAGPDATPATSAANTLAGSNDGNLVLTISFPGNGTPVVEGAYNDVLTFTLASVI